MKKSKILQNILSLTASEIAVKGINFFLHFYLARVLSAEGYGIMSNVVAITFYLIFIMSLGLREIGIRATAGKPELVQKYFSNITAIKLLFAVIIFATLTIYLYANDFSYFIAISFIFCGIQLFAYVVQIDWIFIANERMHILAIRQVIVSAITLIFVLLFVKSINELPLYFLIYSISLLINNLWLIKFANVKIKLEWDASFMKSLLKQSAPLGLSDLFIITTVSFGIIYLAQISTNVETGLFAAALKFVGFASIPAAIIYNTFASKIAQSESSFSKTNIAKKYSTFIFAIGSIIAAECFVFADFNIYITFGQAFLPATNLLKILSFLIVFFYISFSALPFLKYWNQERKVFIAYLISTIIFLSLTITLSNSFNSTGTATAAVFGELSLAIILIIFLFRIFNIFFLLRIIPFLAGAFSITLLSRFAVEIFTDNIYHLAIAIIFSVAIYIAIIIKFKIITTDV